MALRRSRYPMASLFRFSSSRPSRSDHRGCGRSAIYPACAMIPPPASMDMRIQAWTFEPGSVVGNRYAGASDLVRDHDRSSIALHQSTPPYSRIDPEDSYSVSNPGSGKGHMYRLGDSSSLHVSNGSRFTLFSSCKMIMPFQVIGAISKPIPISR